MFDANIFDDNALFHGSPDKLDKIVESINDTMINSVDFRTI